MSDKVIQAIDEQIATLQEMRAKLTGSAAPSTVAGLAAPVEKKKKVISPETKKLMAIAQKKRWAELKKKKKLAEKAANANTSAGKKAPTTAN